MVCGPVKKHLFNIALGLALLTTGALGGHFVPIGTSAASSNANGIASQVDLAVATQIAHNQTIVIENGTFVGVSYLLYDEAGVPFYTNSYPTALLIPEANPAYVVKTKAFYSTGPLLVGAPHILGDRFVDSLVGHRLGDIVEVPYQNASELGHGWDETVTLARTWGPFPLVETVDKQTFHQRINTTTIGETFRLNFRYNATLTSETEDTVTYRILIQDGVPRAIPEMDAFLVATILPDGTFVERIDVSVGTVFTRSNTRLFDLEPGSYVVESVSEDDIVFKHSSLRNTELIGRGARIIAQITEVYG